MFRFVQLRQSASELNVPRNESYDWALIVIAIDLALKLRYGGSENMKSAAKATPIFVSLLCVALIFVNWMLRRANHQLVARVQYLEQLGGPPVGGFIRSMVGTDMSGKPMAVDYESENRPSLLLVFSPYCRFSKLNWPLWDQLTSQLPNTKVIYADLTGEVNEKYFESIQVLAPTQTLRMSDIVRVKENFNLTPTTVVLGPKGEIRRVVLGVLTDRDIVKIKADLASESPKSMSKGG